MIKSNCKMCNKEIKRRGKKAGVFCSLQCKGDWQKTQKPVSKEWLHQKYIVEELGTYEIGKLVNRNAKRVYEWLLGYDIPTRSKHDAIVSMNKRPDTLKKRSKKSMGRRLTKEQRDKISKARTGKTYPKLQGKGNGMFGKTGSKHPGWKGGVTPERQAFYSSKEWGSAVRAVWKRDKGKCRRCGERYTRGASSFHIHHIISFANVKTRADISNLLLVCSSCHHWIHSNKNKDKEFINEI